MRATYYHAGRHLEEAELEPALEQCPVCGGKAPRPELLALQTRPPIALLECPLCRACSASRMPRQAVLDEYYAGYYKGAEARVTCSNPEAFARHIVRRMKPRNDGGPLRLLDVGGGDGTIGQAVASQLRRRQPSATFVLDVVDYGPLASPAHDWLQMRLFRQLEEIHGQYDVVLASGVVEHIPDAHAALRRLFQAVRPQGWFYARTPFVAPVARLHKAVDFTYPGHLHDMGCAFWNRVVETFALQASLVLSQPSFVETTLAQAPLRTALAHLLKLPARLEDALSSARRKDRCWTLVGGWEIVLQFAP